MKRYTDYLENWCFELKLHLLDKPKDIYDIN